MTNEDRARGAGLASQIAVWAGLTALVGCRQPTQPEVTEKEPGLATKGPTLPASELPEAATSSDAPPEAASPSGAPSGPLVAYDRPPIPGFVIYSLERSVVIPFDGSAPTLGEGLWIQDESATPTSWTHQAQLTERRVETMGLEVCPCTEVEGACTFEATILARLDPSTGAIVEGPDPQCRCWSPEEPDFMAPPPPFEAIGGEVDDEVYEPCASQSESKPVSIVGGRLYMLGYDWNQACFGAMSIYDAFAWGEELVADPPPLDEDAGMRSLGCTFDAWIYAPWPLALAELDDDCKADDWVYESELVVARRGWLWRISDDVGHAGGAREVARRRLRPDRCPSANDPCGDPEPFTSRRGFDKREFWIASDGAAALSARGTRYALWRAGEGPPTKFSLDGIDATHDLLGVRVHADVGRLARLIDAHAGLGRAPAGPRPRVDACRTPELFETDKGFVDERGGRGWGARCFEHLQRGHWSAAEAACARGLELASEGGVRGALLYNLGRVAEERGAHERAAALYVESLAARPDNRIVERRLRGLERRLAKR